MTDAALDAVTAAKRAAAEYAVDRTVESGMRIGLGTGSTAVWAVRRVGSLLASGALRDVVAVPTSEVTAADARTYGVPLTTLEVNPVLDVTDRRRRRGGRRARLHQGRRRRSPAREARGPGDGSARDRRGLQQARAGAGYGVPAPRRGHPDGAGAGDALSRGAGLCRDVASARRRRRSSPTRATGSSTSRPARSRTSRDCRTGCCAGPASSRSACSSGWPATSSWRPPVRTSATSPADAVMRSNKGPCSDA